MRTIGRIALGALIGLGLAVAEVVVLIVITEWAISKGWLDVYDDATIAVIIFCSLIAAPIIGGWKAWTTTRS